MLLPFFTWCEHTAVGATIRESTWLFPVIEAVHLLGLAMLGGAVLLVNLRMMGLTMRQQSIADMTRDAMPWIKTSVVIMLASGVLLFLSEAVKCYNSTPFWWKMYGLAGALVFTFRTWRAVASSDRRGNSGYAPVVALVSVALWAVVGWGGRWIGFQ